MSVLHIIPDPPAPNLAGQGRLTISELRNLPATMSVPDAGRYFFGIGRDAAYLAADRGQIPTLIVGRRKLAITSRIVAMLGLTHEAGDVG